MKKEVFKVCLVVSCLCVAPLNVVAQEMVHALAGTVSAIDASGKTITVITDDGSPGLFKDSTKAKVDVDFNKDLRAQTTAADAFQRPGPG